jgi:hypothetical protein
MSKKVLSVLILAVLGGCAVTAGPDIKGEVADVDYCCQLWADVSDYDQIHFLQACSPHTPDTCWEYNCPAPAGAVSVCTGGSAQ